MIRYDTFTLDNGLRVVHSCDPQSAMVVVNVLYDTGSRDESPDLTGMAHLFEHLMFGGSANVESFDSTLELAAGTNNACTSSDFTVFYDQMPAQNAETAFYLESDRMLALAFSDKALEVQRNVVIEEFKQVCLNRPYGHLMHDVRNMAYDKHPYRWPVIGITPDHVAKVTQDDVRRWHASHYAPNNAVLSVVGNISLERTRALAEKWFGPIPAREVAVRHLVDDPYPTRLQRNVVRENVPMPLVAIAYRMDPYGTRGFNSADAITDILSAGESSRLYQRLVIGTDLFNSADAFITGSEDSGLLMVNGFVSRNDRETIDRAEAMLLEQARQLAQPGNVTAYELERTKNRYESTWTFDNMDLVNRAQNLAMAVYHGRDINQTVSDYRSLTLDDIHRTAQRLFIDHAPAIHIITPLTD